MGWRLGHDQAERLTDAAAAAVAEVSRTVTRAGGSVNFKLHDKLAARGLLAKFLGVVGDRVEHAVWPPRPG